MHLITYKFLLLAILLGMVVACSQKSMRVFFDVPEKKETKQSTESSPASTPKKTEEMSNSNPGDKILNLSTWDQAKKALPKFSSVDQVNWTAAMQEKLINPRSSLDGKDDTKSFVFGFDFYIKGPSAMFDAFFPHSVHTQLFNCSSCHPKLFRTRGEKITMEKINAGKYCGACHGKVAFGTDACALCHTSMGK